MIDIEAQIRYWRAGAEDDLESAKILINGSRYLHGLFFCHLVIEKAMKAHVVKQTKDFAPKSHNLIYLSEKAGLTLTHEDEQFIGILMRYQLQGRYPDFNPYIPDRVQVDSYLKRTEKLKVWLIGKL